MAFALDLLFSLASVYCISGLKTTEQLWSEAEQEVQTMPWHTNSNEHAGIHSLTTHRPRHTNTEGLHCTVSEKISTVIVPGLVLIISK